MADDVRELTYREAAARVHRSIRTLWRWRKHGLQMGWGIRDGQRVRLVREDVLLAYWRARMLADPVYRLRVAAQIRADEENEREGMPG
jgi:hypothetical protein